MYIELIENGIPHGVAAQEGDIINIKNEEKGNKLIKNKIALKSSKKDYDAKYK